jgi:putative ABC transport system substrate-binding protein
MRRREFITLLGGAAAWPLAARAQQRAVPVIGFLHTQSPEGLGHRLATLRQGLKEAGFVEATMLGYLHDGRTEAEELTSDILAAARTLGQQVIVVETTSDRDFEPAFATLVEQRASALFINNGVLFTSNRDKLAALAARYRIPAIYPFREFALDGGLMSYGPSSVDAYRLGASYVARILKGAKPADLPVQQPTKFELVINLQTARTLGIEVPPGLLAVADEVIE